MPIQPIQLDRVVTWTFQVDTGRTDSNNHPIYEERSNKIWARREDYRMGRDLTQSVNINADWTQAIFTVRAESVREGLSTSGQTIMDRGQLWQVEDFGDLVRPYGGSRQQYVTVLCGRAS